MHTFLDRSLRLLVLLAVSCALVTGHTVHAAEKTSFKVAWSVYVGWMPWDYADKSGILKKWADRYGIAIRLERIADYVESVNQYTAGKFDACAMTNMEMLTIPAVGGVDSTALIVGDFSNGNDGVVLKGRGLKLPDIKGASVRLIAGSVSHYLLVRGLTLDTLGLGENDIKLLDTPETRLLSAFAAPDAKAVVAWKPLLSEIVATPNTSLVFDSSRIPGEILDLMVVNTAVLRANPKFGRALVGAWYETLGVVFGRDAAAKAAMTAMAQASGTDLANFRGQLATTRMFTLPAEAHGFMTGASLTRTMDLVRAFAFTHDLLGADAKTEDAVGIEFPHGETVGNPKNVKVRFNASFTLLANDGKL